MWLKVDLYNHSVTILLAKICIEKDTTMIKQFGIFQYKTENIKIDLIKYWDSYTMKFMCRTGKLRRFKRKIKEGIHFTFKLHFGKCFANFNCSSQILDPYFLEDAIVWQSH